MMSCIQVQYVWLSNIRWQATHSLTIRRLTSDVLSFRLISSSLQINHLTSKWLCLYFLTLAFSPPQSTLHAPLKHLFFHWLWLVPLAVGCHVVISDARQDNASVDVAVLDSALLLRGLDLPVTYITEIVYFTGCVLAAPVDDGQLSWILGTSATTHHFCVTLTFECLDDAGPLDFAKVLTFGSVNSTFKQVVLQIFDVLVVDY